MGIYYALRAQYWFVNGYTSDILFALSGGATIVNLWHGLPMKCIEFGIRAGVLKKRYVDREWREVFYHPACFIRPDYVASTTAFIDDIFALSFRIHPSRCLHVGYPRNRLFLSDRNHATAFIHRYESDQTIELVGRLQAYRHVYVYMPTWRDSQANLFAGGMDLTRLNSVLASNDDVMLMKPHANTHIDASVAYSNLIFLDSSVDMYAILPFTDVLVSDYSSVLFDYMLMADKAIILYHYDYDEYVREREFNFPVAEHLEGTVVTDFEQLLHVIATHAHPVDHERRRAVIDKLWGTTATLDSATTLFSLILKS